MTYFIEEERHQLLEGWQRFIEKGERPDNINSRVLQSWERSRELNLDPYGGKSRIILSDTGLEKRLRQYQKYIQEIQPFINKIFKNIDDNLYIIFLTDPEGNLLFLKGNPELKNSFRQKYNFFVGASWSEEAVGTTAVSMVLQEQEPVSFMAEEKFCYQLKEKACSAVPIWHKGELMGSLGVAANFSNPNNKVFGMLLAVQMAIENKLKLRQRIRIKCYQ